MTKVSVPSTSAERGRVHQLITDDDEAAGPAGGSQRGDGTGDAAAGDIEAAEIGIFVQEFLGHLLRDGARFEGQNRLDQREAWRVLAKIGALCQTVSPS